MAESGATTESSSNGSDARKNALRAAAIAAASGATAIAARRAFSDRQESGSSRGESGGNGNGNSGEARGGDSLVSGMLASGWGSAKEALVPFAEDAAKAGGEYLAKNGPEVIRDTIVPAFIDGFQAAGKKSNDDDD